MRALFGLILVAGCANDPLYVNAPLGLEAGTEDMPIAQTSLQLPIKTETAEDAMERAMQTADLGVEVPYVKLGDIEVSVEWRITNLTDQPGEALIQLNGANEYFSYDPVAAAVGIDEDEPQPPGLEGDVPLHVEPSATLSGLFREDQLREASIDLDQITRGNVNPFRAVLTISKNATEFAEMTPLTYNADGEPLPQTATGVVYPRAAFAQIVRIDLVFKPDRRMRLEYTVRVRDARGIMHDLLDAAEIEAPDELQTFDPAAYTPALP